jgi:hypothetical protein
VDIEYLRRLSQLTNVIPIISRSDLLSPEDLSSLKENINSTLQTSSIRPFVLNPNFEESPHPVAPYAISTSASKDLDTMDASLLMSPDYVQPLLPSELSYLVSQIFERDTVSWLRHSAAKKFVQWRNSSSALDRTPLHRSLSQSSSSQILTAPVGATTSYALARITDHTQREERIAQVRLANWAADLQRSLANERARFENLAKSERAIWLTERLGECVQDGTIVPLSRARPTQHPAYKDLASTYSLKRNSSGYEAMNPHDPLGLLQLNEDLKRKGWFVLQVVSSLGIIGGLAFYISRSWQTTESETVGLWEWVTSVL